MTADYLAKRDFTMRLDNLRFTVSKEGGRMTLPDAAIGHERVVEGEPAMRFITFTMEELRELFNFFLDVVPDPDEPR